MTHERHATNCTRMAHNSWRPSHAPRGSIEVAIEDAPLTIAAQSVAEV